MNYITYPSLMPTGVERSLIYREQEKAKNALEAARRRHAIAVETTMKYSVPVEVNYLSQSTSNDLSCSVKATLKSLHKRQCTAVQAVVKARAHMDHMDRLMNDLHEKEHAWESWYIVRQQEIMGALTFHVLVGLNPFVELSGIDFIPRAPTYHDIVDGGTLEDVYSGERATLGHSFGREWLTYKPSADKDTRETFLPPNSTYHCSADAATYAGPTSILPTESEFKEPSLITHDETWKAMKSSSNESPFNTSKHMFPHELLHCAPISTANDSFQTSLNHTSTVRWTGQDYARIVKATKADGRENSSCDTDASDQYSIEVKRDDEDQWDELEDANVHARLARLNEISFFRLRRSYSSGAERWVT